MAVSPYKSFADQETLTAADLNASFLQITNGGQAIPFPRTASADFDGYELIIDADADTSITADTDDLIDFKIQGQDLFKLDGTTATSVNGLTVLMSAAGNPVQLKAHGSDTNLGITMVPKGSGQFAVTATTILLDAVTSVDIDGSALILDADADSSLRETSDDVLALKLQGVDAFIFDGDVASPANGLTFTSSATNVDPSIGGQGTDSIVNVRLAPKSTGVAACAGGWAVDGGTNLTWRWTGSGTSLLLQENTGTATAPTWTTRATYVTAVGIPAPGMRLLGSYAPSGAATVDITSVITSAFDRYVIKFNLTLSNDGEGLQLRTDTSNGASFDAGASDYAWHQTRMSGTSTVTGDGDVADPVIKITPTTSGVGNATNEGVAGTINVDFLGSASMYPIINWLAGYLDISTLQVSVTGTGSRLSAAKIDAIRILPSAGTLTGSVQVYGLVNS